MSPSTEVLFQQLYNTENSVWVSALRGDLSDLQGRVKELKSLWKQISQTKDKQLILEARKSFSNKVLQILLGKLSDAKAIEELKEKAWVYFKESQARKEAQEVNKGQTAGGVAEMEKMLWQYNMMLRVLNKHMDIMDTSVVGITSNLNRTKQTVEAYAGHLMQNKVNIVALWSMVDNIQNQLQISSPLIQPASGTSSFPPPKEDESKMDYATAVNQSTIADDSALLSNPIATVTDSSIPSGSATDSIIPTGPTTSVTNLAIATNSITPTGPAASVTDSAIATGPAASNESTGVKSILVGPIAVTGQSMDVDTTGPAPPHAPDEIVP
ncbi:hypothetical protein E4T56_gene187 [Termitomyces sp. T112]|nr:hypothetical protein E4T56_gene187 [Termitomyces sp. T112]